MKNKNQGKGAKIQLSIQKAGRLAGKTGPSAHQTAARKKKAKKK